MQTIHERYYTAHAWSVICSPFVLHYYLHPPLVLAAAVQIIIRLIVALHRVRIIASCCDSLVYFIHGGLRRVKDDGKLVGIHIPGGTFHTRHALGGFLNGRFTHPAIAPYLELCGLQFVVHYGHLLDYARRLDCAGCWYRIDVRGSTLARAGSTGFGLTGGTASLFLCYWRGGSRCLLGIRGRAHQCRETDNQ